VLWVEQHLAPVLKPGDIVVMDNLSAIRSLNSGSIESGGRRTALSAPVLQINPIELAFPSSKLLRDGAERTVDKLWNSAAASSICSQNPSVEIFQHCGYRQT